MNPILALGVLAVPGWMGALAARRIGLPAITGYLVVGLLLGPSVSDVIAQGTIDDLSPVVTPLALGVIAYLIGGSLPLSAVRGLEREIAVTTIVQAVFAFAVVVALVALAAPLVLPGSELDTRSYIALAMVAGAISLATAPAATLAIVEETRAKGPLTTTLLGLVALDDGLAIVAYSFAAGAAAVLVGTEGALSPGVFLLEELGRIGLSTLFGVAVGLPLLWLSRTAQSRLQRQVLVLAAVLLSAGLAERLGLFTVIANMTMGFVIVNLMEPSDDLVAVIRDLDGIVFVLFFTLAGTHLDLGIIRSAGPLAGLIILGRTTGKLSGSWLGATVSDAPASVRRYLGITLLPQAGITVGLALLALEDPQLRAISGLLVSAILTSTLVNELVAPPLAELALVRSGEGGRR